MTTSNNLQMKYQRLGSDHNVTDVDNFIVGHRYSNTITSEGSPIVSTVWTISPFPTFLSFTGTTTGSSLVTLPAVITNNPLIIVFAAAGQCTVTCFVTLADGYTETLGGPITINSPTIAAMQGELLQGVQLVGSYPYYGLRYSVEEENGVTASGTVQSCGLGDDGQIAIMQVCVPARWLQNLQGVVVPMNLNGIACIDSPGEGLITYGEPVPLVNGESAGAQLIDAPLQEFDATFLATAAVGYNLASNNQSSPETFTAWLMYQPAGGYWVPLASFSWSWQALVEDLQVAQSGFTPEVIWQPTSTFPSWVNWVQNGSFGEDDEVKNARSTFAAE